jgi:hypothetical protein
LSLDAFHATDTDVCVAPVEWTLPGGVGGVVSPVGGGQADVEALTLETADRFWAAS